MSGKILTSAQVAEFNEQGFLIVRDFYEADDIVPIQRGIYDVIGLVMTGNAIRDDRGPFSPERFDAGYQELIRRNRALGGIVYDAVKQVPAFFRLVSHPAHETIVRQIRAGAVPAVAGGGHGIRIDNPFEDTFRALWHQEYPAQLRSMDGLVYWSPLVPLTEELGPIQFCPGSHREGPLPVIESDPDHSGRSGAYALVLSEQDKVLSRYRPVAPLTSPGDLVIVDFLTLHASGHNRGARSRWSMQFRYFNFAESTGRAHGWRGSFAAGVDFRTIHPELCARPDEK
jgi:ectoine hydroxylase-related dioxygenase (phytanoyl-CoA dioxygenase family)